jgi:hypothetical protein
MTGIRLLGDARENALLPDCVTFALRADMTFENMEMEYELTALSLIIISKHLSG